MSHAFTFTNCPLFDLLRHVAIFSRVPFCAISGFFYLYFKSSQRLSMCDVTVFTIMAHIHGACCIKVTSVFRMRAVCYFQLFSLTLLLSKQCLILIISISFKAKRIAEAGRTFARDNLMPDKIYCYTALLFKVIITSY